MDEGTQVRGVGPSQRKMEIAVAIIAMVFGAIAMIGSAKIGIGWGAEGPMSGFFPFYIGVLVIAASAVNLFEAIVSRSNAVFVDWAQLRQVFAVIIPTAVYVAIISWIGIYVASILLISIFMRLVGKYPIYKAFLSALVLMATIYWTFEKWFLVPLPKGPLEYWLGL